MTSAVHVPILGADDVVLVGYDLTDRIVADIVATVTASTYVIVTDENIAGKTPHLDHLRGLLSKAVAGTGAVNGAAASPSKRVLTRVLPAGETAKTREMKASVEDWMLSMKCTRDSCLIALGGGVMGDMIGFVAATFMRGVPVIQIPTTLLAMVDSSIGGKTAVDTPHGKNLIGAFHQPRRIFIDLAYIRTLPHREFVNGLAEVIKTAAIWDKDDFALLENHVEEILALSASNTSSDKPIDPSLLQKVVLGSVKVKAHVVTVDERETGLRGLLNFGHTIGHAYEAILAPELLHGECVAIGMVREAEVARALGHLKDVDVGRLMRCLQSYGLPISVDDKRVKELVVSSGGVDKRGMITVERLMDIMKVDKKNQGDQKRMVILAGIGKTQEPKASFVGDAIIRRILSPAVEVRKFIAETNRKTVRLNVPGSKSISNRALVLAALGEGICRLRGLLFSDDVHVMLDALQKLVGISYDWEEEGEVLVINGGGGKLRVPDSEIYLGNAGTAARFLTTVCTLIKAATAGSPHTKAVVTGNARMKQRPIGPLVDALSSNGVNVTYLGSKGCLPLEITPSGKGLPGGHIKLSASISSQYVSSILLSAPYATEAVTLELIGDAVISQPYIDMTISMMKAFGVIVSRRVGTNVYEIPKGGYKSPTKYLVEADASSATYPLAFAAITGTAVTVTNIGSESLQGDSEFAVKVLKPMGCTVTQTSHETTVQGPHTLAPLPSIDMESMTDAFLTASVLAAVATKGGNVTCIHGIANQRVKECDRIAAMVSQLAKFGIIASELPDGIKVEGLAREKLKVPAGGVFCYDDHRIAMSFSLLGAVVPGNGVTVLEKRCVEKTWPAWWDTLESTLGCSLRGIDAAGHGSAGEDTLKLVNGVDKVVDFPSLYVKEWDVEDATLILIGMRGAGKTHMGKVVAKSLRRTFVDMDHYMEAHMGKTIPEFFQSGGTWDGFRSLEVQLLQRALSENPTKCVISCGGGIVETQGGVELLKRWGGIVGEPRRGHVLHILRDMKAIVDYLNIDKTRPVYGEDAQAVWARRSPLYASACTIEFHIVKTAAEDWRVVERDLIRFVKFHLSKSPQKAPRWDGNAAQVEGWDASFFLSLTFPDVTNSIPIMEEISEGVDALELRVDLLKSTEEAFVAQQVALVRRASSLPIIFTVRTRSQGGAFPDAEEDRMFSLLRLGARLGCEFVDVEAGEVHDSKRRQKLDGFLATKGNSHIIASYHDVAGTAVWEENGYGSALAGVNGHADTQIVRMKDKYRELHRFGDSVKLIGRAHNLEDSFALHRFMTVSVPAMNLQPVKPLIALNMGAMGQMSRALNRYFTPVTHPSLPASAAPGQLSVRQIHEYRKLLGLLPAKKIYLFGSPISKSMSPTLHNTGFTRLGLPHVYHLSESADWKHVKDVINKGVKDGSFGGGSVTIPLKEDVVKHGIVSQLSEAAKVIGAVNTLVPLNARNPEHCQVLGDNTDWLGIRGCILAQLKGSDLSSFDEIVGCVIGAGGTSRAALYALQSVGVKEPRVWNRTVSKIESLREVVSTLYAVDSLPAVVGSMKDGNRRLVIIVSTIPGDAQAGMAWGELASAAEQGSGTGSVGIIIEMAYRPRETPLIVAVASRKGSMDWRAVEGIEVLIEQGYEQFVRWTGRRPPREEMRRAVYAAY
ncbi:3-dehydroquinate dehydratase (3-dehydroquinase) [Irineochytrium annulatum]|nr:3-dehydroquinate dehydratase (3-dehydroquinase) [Irineochytrium annulatum]